MTELFKMLSFPAAPKPPDKKWQLYNGRFSSDLTRESLDAYKAAFVEYDQAHTAWRAKCRKISDKAVALLVEHGFPDRGTMTVRNRSKGVTLDYVLGYFIPTGPGRVSCYTSEEERWLVDSVKKEADKKLESEKAAAQRKSDMALARLLVKYGLSDDSCWDNVLDFIRSKDQYLDLAIAGRQTRGDWSEGYYRVEAAFRRFKINDDRDKEIAANIMGCLAGASDGDIDGRVFRDTTWSYDKLFGIVADKSLVEDAELCLTNMRD